MKTAINDFLGFVYQSRSEKTYKAYRNALQAFTNLVGEDAPLTKETYITFLRAASDMIPSTQALYRSAIKGLYYFQADTSGDVDTSFFHMADKRYALKPPKNIVNPDMDGIRKTIEYVNTIRNTPEELRDRAFILLLADSGLRVSEACGLEIAALNMREENAVVTGKGNKMALVKMSHRTTDALAEYFQTRRISKYLPVFLRHDKRAGDRLLPVTPSYIWHYIKRRIAEAGADPKKIRIHDFRHYFVTIVYQSKGIKTAQKWARHERIGTTDRYTHLVEDDGEAYDDVFNK